MMKYAHVHIHSAGSCLELYRNEMSIKNLTHACSGPVIMTMIRIASC